MRIIIFLIICIFAVSIFGVVLLLTDKSVDKICNDYAKNSLQCIEDTR